jgi:hypothetical protein
MNVANTRQGVHKLVIGGCVAVEVIEDARHQIEVARTKLPSDRHASMSRPVSKVAVNVTPKVRSVPIGPREGEIHLAFERWQRMAPLAEGRGSSRING